MDRQNLLFLYQEDQPQETMEMIQTNLGINSEEDEIFIKPKSDSHFFVNTAQEDAATCAKNLLEALNLTNY